MTFPKLVFTFAAFAVLGFAADSPRVYELRTYHCYPGKLEDLKKRFREHTTAIFERHGMRNVGYWTFEDEPLKANTLIYMISHESREQAKKDWAEFGADPEWKQVQTASEVNGKLVEKVDSVFLDPTDFSPMK
jgi:hypothetical protein